MPNETLTFSKESYPDMANLEVGDQVTLTVEGKVATNDENGIQIQTESVETESNGAQQFQKSMSKQPGMMGQKPETEMMEE